MNAGEIAQRFIEAAEVEMKMPRQGERPRGFKGYTLAWVHDFVDISGRGRQPGDSLMPGDDPLEEWRTGWLDEWAKRPSTEQIGLWEECLRWTSEHLDDERERRALWAWAFAKAGRRPHFKRWCQHIEHIHPNTGRKRKDRAIFNISLKLECRTAENFESGSGGGLLAPPEKDDIPDTLPAGVKKDKGILSWASDPSFKPVFSDEPADFSWAAKRWERRRKKLEREERDRAKKDQHHA